MSRGIGLKDLYDKVTLIFEHENKESFLKTNVLQVLKVKAVDGDLKIKNEIIYAITSGPSHVFGINKNTGTVYSKVIKASNLAFLIMTPSQLSFVHVDTATTLFFIFFIIFS